MALISFLINRQLKQIIYYYIILYIPPVPSVAPKDFSLLATTASKVYVQWTKIPDSKYHGSKLGYQVKYKPYHHKEVKTKAIPSYLAEATINNLKAFTLYYFEVAAYTGAGLGPPVSAVLKTPEGGKRNNFDLFFFFSFLYDEISVVEV